MTAYLDRPPRSLPELREDLLAQAAKVTALRDQMVAQYAREWADAELRDINHRLARVDEEINRRRTK